MACMWCNNVVQSNDGFWVHAWTMMRAKVGIFIILHISSISDATLTAFAGLCWATTKSLLGSFPNRKLQTPMSRLHKPQEGQ